MYLFIIFLWYVISLRYQTTAFDLEVNWHIYDHCTILVARLAYTYQPEYINMNPSLDQIVTRNNVGYVNSNVKFTWLIRNSIFNFDRMEDIFTKHDLSTSNSTQNNLHRSACIECALVLVKALQISSIAYTAYDETFPSHYSWPE